ncbi:nitroreductase family protein [Eggerthella timonensis]|uniref:nitroreductase family protein n=1 Tax=Eggerthella timonensis TaxID=1871008 RepID=UPI0015E0F2AE|nr:nitroreductase family protein [Eggerthella timonensis]
METMGVIRSRKSVRSYTGEPVSERELELVLYAAQAAPVVMADYNKFHLTVITNLGLLYEIEQAGRNLVRGTFSHPLYGAPMMILVSAQIHPGRENTMYSSAAMIVHNMALEATELGLGSCCIWYPIAAILVCPETLERLSLPEGFEPCCSIILGKTEEDFPERPVLTNRMPVHVIA